MRAGLGDVNLPGKWGTVPICAKPGTSPRLVAGRSGKGGLSPIALLTGSQGYLKRWKYLTTTTKTTAPNVAAANRHVAKNPGWAHLQHSPPLFWRVSLPVRLPQTEQCRCSPIHDPPIRGLPSVQNRVE
jgi:hypothetical protein